MKNLILLLIAMTAISCSDRSKIVYPSTVKTDVTDTYFGTSVPDPYRWLENDTSAATAQWVEAQNKVTNHYLSNMPCRPQLLEQMTQLANYERTGAPFKRHGKYYFYKNDGLQNQSVLYVQDTPEAEARVFLDPNKLSTDGTVALGDISFSGDGKYMAYIISRSGSDWKEIFVMEVATGTLLPDHIVRTKFTGAEWRENGFYYSAYNAPDKGSDLSGVNENNIVYYHTLGQPQSEDKLVYRNEKYPKRFYRASTDKDEKYLFIYESGDGHGNAIYLEDPKTKTFVQAAGNLDYQHVFLEAVDNKLYFFTNEGADKNKIMVTTPDKPRFEDWQDLIPESDAVIANAQIIDNKLFITYDKDASHRAHVYDLQGKKLHEIQLPSLGSVSFTGIKDEKDCYFTFTSFTTPGSIYKYNTDANTYETFKVPNVKFNPDDFTTEQIFFPSKDGTKIPMFLTYKKGMKKDGKNPVLLYGYGGFEISLNPSFSALRIPFLEKGGIYVMVNLRGGGEYGNEWHLAGTKMRKQNVFDDFIAAAEYLIGNQYTSSEKLAAVGGSNGGLLVGACMTQRPELFRVAIPEVGVMDMLRYHKFTIGWNWAGDYGTSEDSKEMFEYLKGYSPLHNLKPGVKYPSTLVTTADHDDRVVPAHSFKFAATLQECNDGTHPTLIRIDSKAGHGAGKPMSKVIEENADVYGFIMNELKMH